jgi:predicted Ser/Thr protein kinase
MSLRSGYKLGPYEIIAPLGAGGMGEVYRARDARLRRDVALKILPAEVATDPVRRQRFELEARAVAALNHPNIVAVYDVGKGYIVSELVDGQSLRGANLGLRKTIEVAVQIASGLAAAHDAGIVHRDLKPDNVVLTRDGRPKILDFGLAKVQGTLPVDADDTITQQTEPGTVLGTPGYMSPEQVRGRVTDHRSDIFSFGVILYELFAGRRAFTGETSAEVITAILREEPPELPDTVPAALRQVVAHCLEKKPEERFQSAHDLRFVLLQATQSGSQSIVAAPASPVKKIWLWGAMVAVALIAATVAATHWLWRDSAPSQWSGVLLGGPETALDPRLSPDGNLLALRAFDNAQTQVAVMKPESGNWSILTHRRDRGAVEQVSWSPDGSVIYYDRATEVPLGVYSVPVLGGEEHLVLENAISPEALPDGSLLLTRLNAQRVQQLYRYWPETGRIIEFPVQRPRYSAAAVSRIAPGGTEVIAYGSPIGGSGKGPGLYAIDLASNAMRRLDLPEQQVAALQAWTVAGDGKSVVAAIPSGSITRIVAIPISGKSAVRTLFTTTSSIWYLEAARDQSLYVNLVDRPLELVRLSSAGAGPPERIASFPVSGAPDQILLLPDGRTVMPTRVFGQIRLMAAEMGKEAIPLVNTQEETAAPMTMLGAKEIAFVIGPLPHNTIAVAETASGRIVGRIAPGKGVIQGLTGSVDGGTLFFCAGGSVWAVPSSGGEARAVSTGEYAIMDLSGQNLIVVRGESAHLRMFRVPLDGAPEREVALDSSSPLYGDHGGFFSSSSMDAKGRLLVALSPVDSWFNPLGVLATDTGRIARVAGNPLSDHHSGLWTPDGRILSAEVRMRATIWKFQPVAK